MIARIDFFFESTPNFINHDRKAKDSVLNSDRIVIFISDDLTRSSKHT
jgi:hypothetical protein